MTDVLVRVEAPHFTAGLIVQDDKVVVAAPILKWTLGRTVEQLRPVFQRNGWKATRHPLHPLAEAGVADTGVTA